MGLPERAWDTLKAIFKVKDKVDELTGAVKSQQDRIEGLTGRAIRLEVEARARDRDLARLDEQQKRIEDLQQRLARIEAQLGVVTAIAQQRAAATPKRVTDAGPRKGGRDKQDSGEER